jgi:hypothetical protein
MAHWGCTPPLLLNAIPDPKPHDQQQSLQPHLNCQPSFLNLNDWLGGDAAYSVMLPDDQTVLWLFGDSFVRPEGTDEQRSFPFIHNSIGLSTCSSSENWNLQTFWQRQKVAGRPSAFFAPNPQAPWAREAHEESGQAPYYWPFDGFVTDGTLFVGLLRVSHAQPRGPFRLPFRIIGMDLARIDNPLDPPNKWNIRISTLSESDHAFPGSAFVVHGDFVYAFSFDDEPGGQAPRTLSRLPVRALRTFNPNLSREFETFDQNGRWISGFQPLKGRILMTDSGTEMSVHFDAATSRWIAVYGAPGPPRRDSPSTIWIRSANRLEGPWSAPYPLFVTPETIEIPTSPIDPNLFCYAGKAHPEFAEPGNLLVTYVCNLFARSDEEAPKILRRLLASPDLYRPRVISLPIPSGIATHRPESEMR